jgi:hypothetical protein
VVNGRFACTGNPAPSSLSGCSYFTREKGLGVGIDIGVALKPACMYSISMHAGCRFSRLRHGMARYCGSVLWLNITLKAHIRLKYGRGYTVSLKCTDSTANENENENESDNAAECSNRNTRMYGAASNTTQGNDASNTVRVRDAAFYQLFPGAVLTERHSGHLRYTVSLENMPSLQAGFDGLLALKTVQCSYLPSSQHSLATMY